MRISEFTEDTLTLDVDNSSFEQNNKQLVYILENMKALKLEGVVDYSLSYNSLVIYYAPQIIHSSYLKEKLMNIAESYSPDASGSKRIIHIPVCYDSEFALDLHKFFERGLSKDDIITFHTEKEYLIYMIGFLPGFPFLNGVHERLIMKRLSSPRISIPKGSVGIAGEQTGVYPISSPGGWNIIGRTPVDLFSFHSSTQIPYVAGDFIKFESITREEYENIRALVKEGKFNFTVTERSV